MQKQNTQKNVTYEGHRSRVCQKLLENENGFLHNYEILEMMLFLVFKRKDVKPLAKNLIQKFKTINGVLSATSDDLLKIDGIGPSTVHAIKIINRVVNALLEEKIVHKKTIQCFEDVVNFCKKHMENLEAEQGRVIFMNSMNEVLGSEIISFGTEESIEISPKIIIKRCLINNSKSIIIVHNHPSGDPTPSSQDIWATQKLVEAMNIFEIKLFDHIIIGKGRYVSFNTLKLIDKQY